MLELEGWSESPKTAIQIRNHYPDVRATPGFVVQGLDRLCSVLFGKKIGLDGIFGFEMNFKLAKRH